MKDQKGFTIIELIVVVAIIAVLSAIVSSDVIQYKKKGNDAAIKAQMNQIRSAATDYFFDPQGGNNAYTGMCATGTLCFNAKNNILSNLGGTISAKILQNSYCISSTLSDGTSKWCVDNTGYSGSEDYCIVPPYSCTGS